jgi:hypothetical protein
MAVIPTKRLLGERDAARPNLVSQNLLSGTVLDEDCPWVEIGNLYLSVTIVGENSWLPLISLLSRRAESLRAHSKNYVVFTGRHGDIPNVVDQAGKTQGVFDKNHFTEDEKVKRIAESQFGVNITLVDAGQQQLLQTEWLKKATRDAIFARKRVIYAWCYGLFTLCEAPSDAKPMVLNSHATVLISKTVGELVKDYWNWVPRPM